MKKSIRKQIVTSFLGFLFLSIALIVLANYGFMEKVYLYEKEEILKDAYNEIILNYGSVDESDLTRFCSTNNLSAVIYNINTVPMKDYSNVRLEDANRLKTRLFGYLAGLEPEGDKIFEKNSVYTILYNRDKLVKMDFLEMWGKTEDGIVFILRSPIESIKESVNISNRFYLFIGIVIAIVGACFISIYSKKITKPITELTEISRRMANLDFEAKYSSGGENEIGILGHNFNTMSKTLEKTIAELKTVNNELQKDIEKKEEIDEMRKEFLSNVSHELKTPIALIQGYAEGLQDCINDDAESREFYCEVIIDEAAKMNNMVKKLLSLNQLEFGNDVVNIQRFDLTELINGVIQSSTLLAEQKGATISFDQKQPLYVWGDEFKLEEVVTNYISNAINHVDGEKQIEVTVLHQDEKIRVSVFNTGQPIPDDSLDKVWIKFYKVDKARTREYGGSGIGLSIVKAIMDSHHQKYGVYNRKEGVVFWFELDSAERGGEYETN